MTIFGTRLETIKIQLFTWFKIVTMCNYKLNIINILEYIDTEVNPC